MQRVLAGVRVEAAVVAVEHARSEIGEVHLGDALQLPGDRGVRILHVGLVLARRHLQDVGTLQRVEAGGAEVLHHAAALDRLVHPRETIEHREALLLVLDARQEAVGLERAGDARHRHARHGQRRGTGMGRS